MSEPRVALLAYVLAIWWVISALNQIRAGALTLRVRRALPVGVVPLWTFFAPNPARADSRLVWREERGCAWQEWRELHFHFAPPSSRWLFNPTLVLHKAVSDLTAGILRVAPAMSDRTALFSAAYLATLNIVLEQPRSAHCSAVQFAIVRTSRVGGLRRMEIAFVSEPHTVCDSVDVLAS